MSETKTVSFTMSEEIYKALEEIARAQNTDIGEALGSAIKSQQYLISQVSGGKNLLLEDSKRRLFKVNVPGVTDKSS